MKEDWSSKIEKELREVSKGNFLVEKYSFPKGEPTLLTNHFDTYSDGKGKMEIFAVSPGVELSFNCYRAQKITFHHDSLNAVMQINHCRQGRIGWEMKDGLTVYLGSGDLSVHMMDCCAESEMSLPLGYYEGISITINLNQLTENMPEILQDAEINGQKLYNKFCQQGKPTTMPADENIEHIFSGLYDLPENMRLPYYKLKVQELLLFLSMMKLSKGKELNQYFSQQIELIKEIHEQLIHHLDQRFTIEELAKQYLMNTSSLKSIFKTVYGLPIASYMKNYRVKQAARLLRETDDSIAVIAGKIGYGNQSKFTKAFKDTFEILPTEYRKHY